MPTSPGKKRRILKRLFISFSALLLFLCIGLTFYAAYLAQSAKERFSSYKWELPARVYARPLEIYRGLSLPPATLARELELMRYHRVKRIDTPGSFSLRGSTFTLYTRPFQFADGADPARKLRITFQNKRIASVQDIETGTSLSLIRLDPMLLGSFYPIHQQDRLWVKYENIPPLLIQTVLAVEDNDFYNHYGVKPLSILRALLVNIKAGRAVQGGSTLTQQLVKNMFLSHERSIRRKAEEAVMALSLEWFFEKDQIFEAYVNEVYMGQDGKRAIHGFGMASQFYFGRALEHLRPDEIALLVGLLKGPSFYNPRQHPERAEKRRNTVLKVMDRKKLIRPDETRRYLEAELDVIPNPPSGATRFPAFFELVKRQLLKEYDEADLRSEGLRIFTTFDPQVQLDAEAAAAHRLAQIESQRNIPKGSLQTAALITATGSSEILAVVGGRTAGDHGFNRALDARRPVGSLIKPAIYLTALQKPDQFTLITPVDDSIIEIKDRQNKTWTPQNYDRRYHGPVPLYKALAHSYNAAAVRLGMTMGLDEVFKTVHSLGVDKKLPAYPSVLLGSVALSLTDIAQMYHSLASGGFYSPIRAIQSVNKPDGKSLKRYPLTVRGEVDPGAAYLLAKILQTVVVEGTAHGLERFVSPALGSAGKTGTTNDLRDSWFAGFTGNRLAVVWVGRDDNKSCGLTGSAGAMQIWGEMMARMPNRPLHLVQPANIIWKTVNPVQSVQVDGHCPGGISFPFIRGSEPQQKIFCGRPAGPRSDGNASDQAPGKKKNLLDWLKDLFE